MTQGNSRGAAGVMPGTADASAYSTLVSAGQRTGIWTARLGEEMDDVFLLSRIQLRVAAGVRIAQFDCRGQFFNRGKKQLALLCLQVFTRGSNNSRWFVMVCSIGQGACSCKANANVHQSAHAGLTL
jgi:hypothetical protein